MIKVVIADDEEKICQLIKFLIDWKKLGMEIVGVAYNGVEALNLVKDKLPDLIITDIRMPGYDGLELIKRSKEINENLHIIIISGFQHFEYAQNAMKYGVSDYILKPIREEDLLYSVKKIKKKHSEIAERKYSFKVLENRLKYEGKKLRNNLFLEFIFSQTSTTNNATIDQINENYHYSFKPGFFQVAIVKIDSLNEETTTNALAIIKEHVVKTLKSMLINDCYELGLYDDENYMYVIINASFSRQRIVKKQLKAVVKKLNTEESRLNNSKFTIGVGVITQDINLLYDSYRSARYSIMERLLLGTEKLIEEVPIGDKEEYHEVLLSLNKPLEASIEILDKKSVLDSIINLKETIASKSDLNGENLYWMVEETWRMYIHYLQVNKFISVTEYNSQEKFSTQASNCRSMNELFNYLITQIEESMDLIIEGENQKESKPIRIAKQYIQKHYMEKITLEEVSDLVGFNSTYFSTVFKKDSGNNFVDYLTDVRINKAKELLREDLSINVICEEVGYLDMKHFKKTFKKKTGLNPNEFRKLYT